MDSVLITGANRGIGFEFTKQFYDAGWRVFACCRDPAAENSRDLNMLSGWSSRYVTVHRLDVTKQDEVDSLAQRLAPETIDIVINNAGVNGPKQAFGATDYAQWADAMATNVFGPMKVAEAFVEHVARSERKIIATVSSRMGSITQAEADERHAYRSSKAAVNMVMKNLAGYVADRGITSVSFSPGWVKTEMGGPDAPVEIEETVSGMRKILERLTLEDSGKFIHFDGTELPW